MGWNTENSGQNRELLSLTEVRGLYRVSSVHYVSKLQCALYAVASCSGLYSFHINHKVVIAFLLPVYVQCAATL